MLNQRLKAVLLSRVPLIGDFLFHRRRQSHDPARQRQKRLQGEQRTAALS